MIYPPHLINFVIEPVLIHLGLYTESAARLLLGTALVESRASYLRQHPSGPALGLYQMEPDTFRWLWWDWLPLRRPGMRDRIAEFIGPWHLGQDPVRELTANLYFATALCRIRYLTAAPPLPAATDIQGLGQYWKNHYNTAAGKGRVQDWVDTYKRLAMMVIRPVET